ncbi:MULTISPECIES: enoyl-CoA hydratase/isomerase family protein [Streptomyces]|uniref:Enoyl-CoA hydratase/isomerase family protein n=2 Tax=Streptomyces TaxID=1883 RepID=A0A3M8EWW4_9ACTN|nr:MULTISPECIES: enoyl-CoA hydratase/isomerase family protein [Streptomyces]PQM20126.1 enoyl-CoA hydratase/isomerase family protein [Streptomyces xinghaiensis]RKM96051.1 enoyl-CoA hydratase/isomerase family protein [Streptomyces xinghaiensis]RNC70006.1 enoyl-CoA hydratase/isomerase family protein [Streptomyces xinghaiensis]
MSTVTETGHPERDPVRYERNGPVAVVELHRPHRLNAVTDEVSRELVGALRRAVAEGARAVVLTGAGRAFCSGHDLKEPAPAEDPLAARERLERLQDVTRTIKRSPVPVIAAVHGWAVGAGCEWALACDLVVAAEYTRFMFPEAGVGLTVTNGVSQLLAAVLGPQRAKYLLMTGSGFTAEEARGWGLVNEVVPDGEHRRYALELAGRLLDKPPLALALAKETLDRGLGAGLEETLAMEVDLSMRVVGTGTGSDPRAGTDAGSEARAGTDATEAGPGAGSGTAEDSDAGSVSGAGGPHRAPAVPRPGRRQP